MSLSAEYFISVFIAALAVIQLSAARAGLRGLIFGGRSANAYYIAIPLLLIAGTLFFTWNDRNPTGVIEGAQQAGLFSLAVAVSALITILITSIINHKRLKPAGSAIPGLEGLRNMTFFQVVRSRYWKA